MIGQIKTLRRTTGYTAVPEVIIETINLRSDVLKSFSIQGNSIIVETTDMMKYDFIYTRELEDELNELFNPEIKVMIQVDIKLEEGAQIPVYGTEQAAGADVHAYKVESINPKHMFEACLNEDNDLVLKPGGRALISTGMSIQLPEGYEAQLRPRSGLALKHGISLANCTATIDSDYTGVVGIILINHGFEDFIVKNGERIAQMVIAKHETALFEMVESLNETARGEGGFGHTGK